MNGGEMSACAKHLAQLNCVYCRNLAFWKERGPGALSFEFDSIEQVRTFMTLKNNADDEIIINEKVKWLDRATLVRRGMILVVPAIDVCKYDEHEVVILVSLPNRETKYVDYTYHHWAWSTGGVLECTLV